MLLVSGERGVPAGSAENTRGITGPGNYHRGRGGRYSLGIKDIVSSGYVSNQCRSTGWSLEPNVCGSGDYPVFRMNRYTLEDAKVSYFTICGLRTGVREITPWGLFEVSEANRTLHCLELKGMTACSSLRRVLTGLETVGNACAFLALHVEACRVELAHTRQEVKASRNGSGDSVSVYKE